MASPSDIAFITFGQCTRFRAARKERVYRHPGSPPRAARPTMNPCEGPQKSRVRAAGVGEGVTEDGEAVRVQAARGGGAVLHGGWPEVPFAGGNARVRNFATARRPPAPGSLRWAC